MLQNLIHDTQCSYMLFSHLYFCKSQTGWHAPQGDKNMLYTLKQNFFLLNQWMTYPSGGQRCYETKQKEILFHPIDRTPHRGTNLSHIQATQKRVRKLICFDFLAGPSKTRPWVWISQGWQKIWQRIYSCKFHATKFNTLNLHNSKHWECSAQKCNLYHSATKKTQTKLTEKHSRSKVFVILDRSTPEGVFWRDRPESWNKSIFAQNTEFLSVATTK